MMINALPTYLKEEMNTGKGTDTFPGCETQTPHLVPKNNNLGGFKAEDRMQTDVC